MQQITSIGIEPLARTIAVRMFAARQSVQVLGCNGPEIQDWVLFDMRALSVKVVAVISIPVHLSTFDRLLVPAGTSTIEEGLVRRTREPEATMLLVIGLQLAPEQDTFT